jgi:predicted nucleic acid-binding protein
MLQLPRIKEKYAIADDDIADLMALFVLRGDLVIPDRQVTVCRDSEDNMVIEAALAGEAPWVVTGDEDLLSLGTYEAVSFVTPRAFLERLDEGGSGTSADEAPDSGDRQS